MKLTSHERIMRIFQNKEVDRPALKLWGASLDNYVLHPAYKPVCELACQKSDLFVGCGSAFNIYCGNNSKWQADFITKDTEHAESKDQHVIFHTPKGDLHGIERISTVGDPSYTMEYLVKEPEDLDKLLSIPYEPHIFEAKDFFRMQAKVGDRGVAMFGLDHAGYALHRLLGSENLAYFSIDCREKLEEVMDVFLNRLRDFLHLAIEEGIRGPFAWVGPEVFIPPLLSPKDFTDFIYRYDKVLCDDIHNAGGYVWVHSHGKVANFIKQYIDMGVDVLNPLEPSKNGDIDLAKIIEKYSNLIGWEGNIEIQDIIEAQPHQLKELIKDCVNAGNESGRFILCPSAGFMEYPIPSDKYIQNLLLYLNYGYECVENCR